MKWKTTNYQGKEVTWISEDEIDGIIEEGTAWAQEAQSSRFKLDTIQLIAKQGNQYCKGCTLRDCGKCIKASDCKTMYFKMILGVINDSIEDDSN